MESFEIEIDKLHVSCSLESNYVVFDIKPSCKFFSKSILSIRIVSWFETWQIILKIISPRYCQKNR